MLLSRMIQVNSYFRPQSSRLPRQTSLFHIAVLAIAAICIVPSTTSAEPEFDKSVVQVIVTYQTYDPSLPWQRTEPRIRRGYAVVTGDGLAITTEDLVRNHTLVEIRPARSGIKTQARVVLADDQVNLALLDIGNDTMAKDMRPAALAAAVDRDQALEIVQFDDTGQVQTGAGHIAEISVLDLPKAQSSALMAQVLTDLTINGQGGAPVFINDQLFGLVMQYDKNTKTCYVLPYVILRKFIEESAISPYPGVASAGLLWERLIDPFKRAYLCLSKDQTGIVVLRTLPASDNMLLQEDVIMEWNGVPIDSQGYYQDPEFGRILFSHLIRGKQRPGDIVPVTVIRNGQQACLEVELRRLRDADNTIPFNVTGEQAEYLVEGGLIIRELTFDYLEARGSKWPAQTDPRLLHMYLQRHQLTENPEDRIVILSRVLPDPINIGYEQFGDQVITKVNGDSIRNLSDVFRIAERDGGIHRVSLQSLGIDIVLDPARLSDANARIAKSYHIPKMRHFHPETVSSTCAN